MYCYEVSFGHEEHKLVQINWINSKLMNNDILNKQTTTTKNERQPSTAIYHVRVGQELLIFPATMTSISFIELIDFSVVVFFFWHCHLSSFFVRLCCQQLVIAHVQVQVQLLQKCIHDANASSTLDEWNFFFQIQWRWIILWILRDSNEIKTFAIARCLLLHIIVITLYSLASIRMHDCLR